MSPFIGIRPRVDGPAEPRGRLFDHEQRQTPPPPGLSVLQAMEILERIADRRAQYVGVSLGLADRIQVLP
jgi:hypothetical protein